MAADEQPGAAGTPHSDVVGAAGLVSYQPGGVVSRQIVKKPTGNVTVFAFDDSQELTEHSSPFDALVLVLEGEAEIAVAGRPLVVRAGQMVVLPADVPHAVKAITRFKMLLTMIRS